MCPLDTCDVRSRNRAKSAVIQPVSSPLPGRIHDFGPGPPAARCSPSSESSALTHPRPVLRSAPVRRPGRHAARPDASRRVGPSSPSRPSSMLQCPPVSVLPPHLPFSHVAVQTPLRNGKSGAHRNRHIFACVANPLRRRHPVWRSLSAGC